MTDAQVEAALAAYRELGKTNASGFELMRAALAAAQADDPDAMQWAYDKGYNEALAAARAGAEAPKWDDVGRAHNMGFAAGIEAAAEVAESHSASCAREIRALKRKLLSK